MRTILALSLIAGLFTVIAPMAAQAATLDVSYTLQGCNLDPATYDITTVTCSDDGYTTGNLGKDWNELDLVPFRTTLKNNGSSTESGSFIVAGDYTHAAGDAPDKLGWDFVSTLTLNTDLSDLVGCSAATTGSQTITPSGDGVGGSDQTIYREVTASVPAHTTCVYDWFMRLALGAHLFSGSSLQANLWDENLGSANVGEKRVSIPVKNAIEPQTLSKDMVASRGTDHIWTIEKSATPTDLSFTNTCDTTEGALQTTVDVTVSWDKEAANPTGPVTVNVKVYATNPAHRTIDTKIHDVVQEGSVVGSGAILDDFTGSFVTVPAETANVLVLDRTFEVTTSATSLNDTATGTYRDTVTQLPIPQTTTATDTADVTNDGAEANASATITDSEYLDQAAVDAGLSFSVAALAVTDPGAFSNYTGGDVIDTSTDTVDWSADVSDGGSITFYKTVYATAAATGSGNLSDDAQVDGSDTLDLADTHLDIAISAGATSSFTIDKTIPNILQGSESATFTFNLFADGDGPAGVPLDSKSLTFNAGDTAKSVTFDGLDPDTDYDVYEDVPAHWANPTEDPISGLPVPFEIHTTALVAGDADSCSGSASLENGFGPASAQAIKVTVPAGSEAGWEMILTGPGTPVGGEKLNTAAGGTALFTTALQEGSYTIAETNQAGWSSDGGKGDCSFTVNYPADADKIFSCTFTNTAQATAKVIKVTNPAGSEAGWEFTLTGPGIAAAGEKKTTGANGEATFAAVLQAGTYTIAETTQTGWDADKTSCQFTVVFPADAGKVKSCTFTNTKRGEIDLTKLFNNATPTGTQSFTFDLRTGASQGVAGTVLTPPGTVTLNSGNGWKYNFTNLVPNTYQLCESNVPVGGHSSIENMTGWFSTGTSPADNSTVCVPVVVGAGSTVTISVNDTPPPGGDTRTIGYWKNWSSCAGSKGKQAAILDQTMAKGAITIGNITLSAALDSNGKAVDCIKAVRILDKSSINNGTKLASDPAYNLAAQLLAAKLNVQAGAKTCTAVSGPSGYITQAQNLLVAVNFTGVYTNKNSPGHGTISASQATQMNNLAKFLDSYNNNATSICP